MNSVDMVYKSDEGMCIVREVVSDIYSNFTEYEYEGFRIDSEAGETYIMRFGDEQKPPLVMLHGSTSNNAAWFGSLSFFINDFCIYLIDVPGEPGLSEAKRIKLASKIPAAWFLEVLDALKIEKAAFVTMSLGSWFGLNFAVNYPDRVKAMSLITTSGIEPAKVSFILKALFCMMLGKPGQKMLNKAIYYKVPLEMTVEQLRFQEVAAKHFKPLTEAVPIFTDDQLKQINFPLQYFGGDHDVLLNSEATGKRIKEMVPSAEVNILAETGHVILGVFDKIADFLKE
ncbi:MAG: alpha/beta hydrolase [Spirochaetales bacterium]|nr:alpha/beta hydrolase [Spirochaetales bacterium]